MKELIKKIQKEVGVIVDGDLGPITLKAITTKLKCDSDIKSLQRTLGVVVDGVIGIKTLNAIVSKLDIKESDTSTANGEKVIAIAKTQLGIHEVSRNHGDGISKYWTATNYPGGYAAREPYCAACMAWCIREADIFDEKERPKTPAAYGFENWADNLSTKTKITRNPSKVKRGQLVVFNFSHIGIATSDSNSSGTFSTIEANTGASGSRDGDGVYEKTRDISRVHSVITLL